MFLAVAFAPISAAKRALPNSPSGGYAPDEVTCPTNRPSIRSANALSPSEVTWLEQRRKATIAPMREFLIRMNITGFDAGAYIDTLKDNVTSLPNIGLAVSGGGYRALMKYAPLIMNFG